jgi:hypothetical protein
MENSKTTLIQRTSPGGNVPFDLPSEALFVLNLGPYLSDDTLSDVNYGHTELQRAARLRVLIEKLEEVADVLEDIGYAMLESDEPSPTDHSEGTYEEVLEFWGNKIQKELEEQFDMLATVVDSIESAVAAPTKE